MPGLEDRELEELEELDRELEELEGALELEEDLELEELDDLELADAGRLRVPAALAIAAQICVIVAPSGTPRWRARANRRSTSRL
jgi:hypothetical protein